MCFGYDDGNKKDENKRHEIKIKLKVELFGLKKISKK